MTAGSNKWKTAGVLFACALLPCAVLLAVYAAFGMAPFGDKSILIMDLSDQYVEFFAGLKHILQGDGSLFFSWSKTMGTNFFGVFAYILSSPLSILPLLFPEDMLPVTLLFLNVLKLGLAGTTFGIYLIRTFRRRDASTVAFSLFYALMSYSIVYSMNLMWLDALIWLPIVLLGVDKLLETGRMRLLTAALFVIFISNYYTSYMVGAFALVYFIYRYFCIWEGGGRRRFAVFLGRFLGSAVWAAALGAFFLLPALFGLVQGKIGGSIGYFPRTLTNFYPTDFFNKLYIGVYDSIVNDGAPALYCSVGLLFLLVGYFTVKTIPRREKMLSGGVLGFLLLSLFFTPLDTAWQLFQPPNWFPYRYLFVVVFFALYLGYAAFTRLEEAPRKLLLCMPLAIFAAGVCLRLIPQTALTWKSVLLTCLFALVYLVIWLALQKPASRVAGPALALLVLAGAAETYLNSSMLVQGLNGQFGYKTNASYVDFRNQLTPLVAAAKGETEGFFRMEKTFERSKNDAIGLGYHGITHYSSLYHRDMNALLKNLGFAQYFFWSSYYGSTMLTDALFDIRYVMSKKEVSALYPAAEHSGDVTLYRNPYALPLGYLVPRDLNDGFFMTQDSLANQNRLLRAMTGMERDVLLPQASAPFATGNIQSAEDTAKGTVYTRSTDGNGSLTFRVTVTEDGPLYASFLGSDATAALFVNGRDDGRIFTHETDCVRYLGTFRAGETVTARLVFSSEALTYRGSFFYTLDMEAFSQAVDKLQSGALQNLRVTAQTVSGTVSAQEDSLVFTSIPYDAAWQVLVDGERVTPVSFENAFLCVPVSAGIHDIRLVFHPPGLYPGLAITLLACSFTLVFLFRRRRREPIL